MAVRVADALSSLLFISVIFSLSHCAYVPVLFIASDNSFLPQTSVSAVEKISKEDFLNEYLEKIPQEGPFIFFQQDTLSGEDFGFYGGAYGQDDTKDSFKNLKSLANKYPSVFLPSVEAIKQVPKKLTKEWKLVEINKDTTSKLNEIEVTKSTLIVVKLPDTLLASDRGLALKENDVLIRDVFNKVVKVSKKFTMIFTAQQPSWTSDHEEHVRISRHILEAPEDNDTFIMFTNDYTMFFASDVQCFVKANKSDEIAVDLGRTVNGSTHFDNESLVLTLTFDVRNDSLSKISIIFTFSQTVFSWTLETLSVTGVADGLQFDQMLPTNDMWTPADYSYTCKDTGKIYDHYLNDTILIRGLRFQSLQIQPFFNGTAGKFGDQFDCVGFFTIPIWVAIFVSLILMIILAFGVSLLMDIHTMDRFDDPKGKTIQVATFE